MYTEFFLQISTFFKIYCLQNFIVNLKKKHKNNTCQLIFYENVMNYLFGDFLFEAI
jgi:hypothetical protein